VSTRRQATRARNQAILLQASRQVFARQDFGAVTIRDIVRESGLSRGTFYNYLGSKEAAFEAVAADLVEQIRTAVAQARAHATDPESFIAEPFRALIRVLASDEQTLALVTRNGMALREVVGGLGPTEGLEAELRRDLDQAVEAGLLPPHPTEWMAAAMLGASLEVVARLQGSTSDAQAVGRAGDFLAGMFLAALRSQA